MLKLESELRTLANFFAMQKTSGEKKKKLRKNGRKKEKKDVSFFDRGGKLMNRKERREKTLSDLSKGIICRF